ncbi:MAG: helix-turn-helix domain-containing protein [Puniceicoccales bacterium]
MALKHLNSHTASADYTMCWRVVSGNVTVDDGSQVIEAKPGQWLFLKSQKMVQHFSRGAYIWSIRFMFRQRTGGDVFRRQRNLLIEAADYPEVESSAADLLKSCEPWQPAHSMLVTQRDIPVEKHFLIQAAFARWISVYTATMLSLGAQLNPRETNDARVSNALVWIDHFSMKQEFREGNLAMACGLSVNQLCRLFKRDLGLTPYDYYEKRRLEEAHTYLRDSSAPVKEIAFELGFNSLSGFSNWFRKKEGLSPREFRRAASEAG